MWTKRTADKLCFSFVSPRSHQVDLFNHRCRRRENTVLEDQAFPLFMSRWSGDITLIYTCNKNILEYSVTSAEYKVYASSYLAFLYYSLSPLFLSLESWSIESILFPLVFWQGCEKESILGSIKINIK